MEENSTGASREDKMKWLLILIAIILANILNMVLDYSFIVAHSIALVFILIAGFITEIIINPPARPTSYSLYRFFKSDGFFLSFIFIAFSFSFYLVKYYWGYSWLVSWLLGGFIAGIILFPFIKIYNKFYGHRDIRATKEYKQASRKMAIQNSGIVLLGLLKLKNSDVREPHLEHINDVLVNLIAVKSEIGNCSYNFHILIHGRGMDVKFFWGNKKQLLKELNANGISIIDKLNTSKSWTFDEAKTQEEILSTILEYVKSNTPELIQD